MSILFSLMLMQVGPNPLATDSLGLPDELLNRPAREQAAASNPTSQWLSECLDQLAEDPARAHSKAQIRLAEVDGADRVIANHCLGLAAIELGLWEDARNAFHDAKNGSPVDDKRARARFGTMAGNAALGGGNLEAAIWLLEAAREDASAAASATLEAMASTDLARAYVAQGRDDDALAMLDMATFLETGLAESWLLKATLLRRLDRLVEAQEAIEKAGELAPMEVAIGLEAGVIAVLSGREDAARQSWQSVIDSQPSSLAAQTARGYLDQLGPADQTPTP